jgi:hypothetical protein
MSRFASVKSVTTIHPRRVGTAADANPIASIEKILNLNHEPPQNPEEHDVHLNGFLPESTPLLSDGQAIWKVLVFDNFGRDVVSSGQ